MRESMRALASVGNGARAMYPRLAMDALMDRALARLGSWFEATRLRSPSIGLLGEARSTAASEVVSRYRAPARELVRRIEAGDRDAAVAFGELAERALDEMRREVLRRARALPQRLTASLHERFGRTDEREYLDDADLDREMRVRLLATLDAFNTVVGNYRAFFNAMEPLLTCDAPTRVLDLAAGHGGFALEAMRIARARNIPLEITATDLVPEYLALGEAVARREGLPVRFAVQDALDLSNLRTGEYDVVICTQSLHHFPASMTARIFREATRIASRGVVLIDGCRSVVQGLLAPVLGVVRYRDPAFAHDAWVSCRRFYAPEEVGLLASLAVPDDSLEVSWMPPGHCLVRWRRPPRASAEVPASSELAEAK